MAESFVLHFKTATCKQIASALDALALRRDEDAWLYPPNEPCMILYLGDDSINEYDDPDVDRLADALSDLPTCSLDIQLLRSEQYCVCDVATELAYQILNQYDGVADDWYSHLWTGAEIRSGVRKSDGKFLDCYRLP